MGWKNKILFQIFLSQILKNVFCVSYNYMCLSWCSCNWSSTSPTAFFVCDFWNVGAYPNFTFFVQKKLSFKKFLWVEKIKFFFKFSWGRIWKKVFRVSDNYRCLTWCSCIWSSKSPTAFFLCDFWNVGT